MPPAFCNGCFKLKSTLDSSKLQLFFLKCSHVFCEKCLVKTCKICNRPTKKMPIDKRLLPNLAVFFMPLSGLFDQYRKVLRFQSEQQALYIEQRFLLIQEHYKKKKSLESHIRLCHDLRGQVNAELERIRRLKSVQLFYESSDTSTSQLESRISNSIVSADLSKNYTKTIHSIPGKRVTNLASLTSPIIPSKKTASGIKPYEHNISTNLNSRQSLLTSFGTHETRSSLKQIVNTRLVAQVDNSNSGKTPLVRSHKIVSTLFERNTSKLRKII